MSPKSGKTPSLAAMATDRIRDAIVSGQLKLGAALSEDKLAAMLGISRTPVREALATLNVQGLITILPQRGSFVFQPSEADVRELCEFRVLTEVRAMWLAHARAKEETLARMQAAQARMDEALAWGDNRATAAADAEFHDAFFTGCANQFLAQAYGLIAGRVSAVRSMLLYPSQTKSASADEHHDIMRAFSDSNLIEAEALLAAHILKMSPRFRSMQLGLAAQAPKPRGRRKVAAVPAISQDPQ